MSAIQVDRVTVRFGDFVALPELDLEVAEGEFFTLLGPSGCGKSTALRTLAGFTEPTSGRISIDGRDVTRLPSHQRQIGMVFQNYALFPSMSVHENIAFGLRVARQDRATRDRRVREIAEQVDLSSEQLSKNVAELSGGQQQRVAIARALVLRPKILLLDEPLSNLDAKLRQQLRVQLKDLQQQFGITTVYVTHDQDEALTLSDRIAVMDRGRIQQVGTPEQVYSRSANEFVCTFVGEVNRLDAAAWVERCIDQGHRAGPAGRRYLRIEKTRLLRAGESRPDPAVVVDGTVLTGRYHGLYRSYRVGTALGELRALRPEDGSTPLEEGAEVTVAIRPEDVLRYDEAPTPGGHR